MAVRFDRPPDASIDGRLFAMIASRQSTMEHVDFDHQSTSVRSYERSGSQSSS